MSAVIQNYFPELTARQLEQFDALGALYNEWNAKINVISRRDIGNLYERHILHSLGIAVFLRFPEGANVLDAGTGGGFPGIPLAIFFPDVRFHLIDSTGKKINVARSVAGAVGLTNVTTRHCRIEEERSTFDFVVSRATLTLPELVKLIRKNIDRTQRSALPNGVICLKGGELGKELSPFGRQVIAVALSDYFREDFFATKKVIYMPL